MDLSLITTVVGAYSSMRRLGFWDEISQTTRISTWAKNIAWSGKAAYTWDEISRTAKISAWAKNIAKSEKAAYERYFGMGMLYGRKLDFDPSSNKPKLLIISTLSDDNGSLSSENQGLINRITGFIPQLLRKWNIQYRLAKSAPEICRAVQTSAPDAIMFDVHGSPKEFAFDGRTRISDFPRTCFTTVKKKLTLFLFSCKAAKGSSSIAEKMSDLLPPNSSVVAPSCPASHFVVDLNRDPPIRFKSQWGECETRTFSSPNYCSSVSSPPEERLFPSPPPSPPSHILMTATSLLARGAFEVYRCTIELSFALKVTGFVLEKSPTLFCAISSATRNLLIRPALYCGKVAGLNRQKRAEILDRWNKIEENVYKALRTAAQYAPYIERPAHWVDHVHHEAMQVGIDIALITTNRLSHCSCWAIDKISARFNHPESPHS